jgi:hypothetical protein
MFELILLMCTWDGPTGFKPSSTLVCGERVLVRYRQAVQCDLALDRVKTDGRNVTVFCRYKPTVNVEK